MSGELPREDLPRLEQLFERAVELPRNERAAFVAAECGSNEALGRELRSLLDALDSDDRLAAIAREAPSRSGTRIGPYELLRRVGEGGMGEVYLAEQRAPVKRRVALKLIKPGMDSRQVIARFEGERQTLALMDHPGIATVLDAGTSQAGQPYFVMEFIEGPSILEHCDRQGLGIPERLQLFVGVCNAIQHAHQKGVIHRDIKPSNVRVTRQDGRAVPKVIDFGIAKALHGEAAPREQLTQELQRVGTPAYMSPEQAGLGGLDVDTRSDVYSLGVLLYELLTGTTPLDPRRIAESDVLELLRAICEETPLRPSARVSAPEALAATPVPERTDTRHLRLTLRGDLDWIVMRCLEKDRARRYATANDLAEDIERYLHHEPVSAGPPSATYRLRKFVRRNRAGVMAALALALVLVVGAVGTVRGLVREQERARELQQVADFQAGQLGKVDAKTMGVRLRRALLDEAPEARRGLLTETVSGINFTNIAMGSLRENLFQPALESIDAHFEDQPLVRAQLLQALAQAMTKVGLYELAEEPQARALELRERELGRDHRDTLGSMVSKGGLLIAQGRFEEARYTIDEAIEGLRTVLGEDDPATLFAMGRMGFILREQGQYEEAEPYYVSVLEELLRTKGEDDQATLVAMSEMGRLRLAQSRLPEAESWARKAVVGFQRERVLGEDTLTGLANLGEILYAQRKFAEAAPIARRVYDGFKDALGDEHPDTLTAKANLAGVLLEQGELSEAERLVREVLDAQRRILGADHPDTLATTANLGVLYHHLGRPREAVPCFRACFEASSRTLGEDHPSTLRFEASLGRSYFLAGDPAAAVPLLDDVYTTTDDPELRAWVGDILALALAGVGELEAARAVLKERLEEVRDSFPEDSVELGDELHQIGIGLVQTKDWVEAEATLRECIRIREQARANDWTTSSAKVWLGQALMGQARFADAEDQLLAGYEGLHRDQATIPPSSRSSALPDALRTLVRLYSTWERAEPGQGHGDQVPRWKATLDQYGVDPPQPPVR